MRPASLAAAEKALQADREGRLRWVEPDLGYPGRVVNLRIGTEGYHFVATAEGARLERGEYPAPDGSLLLADPKVWERLASGALSVGEAIRTKKARVWGNLNDVQALLRIVSRR